MLHCSASEVAFTIGTRTIDVHRCRGDLTTESAVHGERPGRLRRPQWMSRLPRAVLLLLKPALQALAMLWLMLFRAPQPDIVILQLPPTVWP